MKHIHVWTFGSPTYDWQVCRECGAIKPEEHICWTDDTVCNECGNPCPNCGADYPPITAILYGMCLSCYNNED